MTAIKRILLAILLCLPSLAQSQAPPQPGAPPQGGSPFAYVLFIHCGPKNADDPVIKQLAILLARQGYSVREPENDQDLGGGPGVDYFDDQARAKAEEIAKVVSDYLAGLNPPVTRKLTARRQTVKNSSTYLGVWLF